MRFIAPRLVSIRGTYYFLTASLAAHLNGEAGQEFDGVVKIAGF